MSSTKETLMQNRRQFLSRGTALTVGALLGSRAALSLADNPNITRIEEDWEIQVSYPNPDRHTPELVTSMGPLATDSEAVGCLLINHVTKPTYASGGVQLQVWKAGQLIGYSNYALNKQLATANETIRFTLVMELEGMKLKYQVTGGSSSTFGTFGGLWVTAPTALQSLVSYSPLESMRRSAISVGGNRLSKYQINEVRVSTESGETIDKTVRSCL